MCGILTLVTKENNREQTVQAMLRPLRESRGPDAWGINQVEENQNYKVFLAHARLSIIDVGKLANQPMIDPETGIALTYNGEIYNYKDLQNQLESSWQFRTQSDTEVLLAGLVVWGLEKTLNKLRGMFAFVFYDPRTKTLYAARDRAGEKPLSFGKVGDDWVFTSDLRVLGAHPDWSREVSLKNLRTYFRYRFVPHPESIFVGFNKLGPGQCLKFVLGQDVAPIVKTWWSICEEWGGNQEQDNLDFRETLGGVVRRTVEASDVPVGCFLSGGVDSSLVSALAAKANQENLRAYTIQFKDEEFDESKQAAAIASSLNLSHTVVPFGFSDFKIAFEKLNGFLDEPAAVHSFYPLGFLAERAREDVKVCLSGDGGDELFGGYNRYLFWQSFMKKALLVPEIMRKVLGKSLATRAGGNLFQILANSLGQNQIDSKREKIIHALNAHDLIDFYQTLLQQKQSPLGQGGVFPIAKCASGNLSSVEHLMAMDFNFYLPGDVLNKVDRATMAVGLESRAPLLDLDVIKVAGQMPLQNKIDKGQGKLALKKWLEELLPDIKHNQPKAGFTTPIVKWRQQLFEGQFFEHLEESVLNPFIDPEYKKRLTSGDFAGEEGFTLYCVLTWLHKHDLKVVDK